MKVEVVRSGGFANIPVRVTLDTDSMPPAAANELETKLRTANFFRLPPAVETAAGLRDAYQYRVTVTTPEGQRTVVFSGGLAPAAQDLIDYLQRVATAARGGS